MDNWPDCLPLQVDRSAGRWDRVVAGEHLPLGDPVLLPLGHDLVHHAAEIHVGTNVLRLYDKKEWLKATTGQF